MDLKWRVKAKVVAYLDLILTSMGLLLVILITIFAGAATALVEADLKDPDSGKPLIPKDADVKSALWIIWTVVGILALMSAIQLWAAIRLMNATEIGRDAAQALAMSANWRNVTIVFLLIELVCNITTGSFIWGGIWLVIRATFLFIGCNFMSELKDVLNNPIPNPTQVTVKF